MKNKIIHLYSANDEILCGEKNPDPLIDHEVYEACWPCGELYAFILLHTDDDADTLGVKGFTC